MPQGGSGLEPGRILSSLDTLLVHGDSLSTRKSRTEPDTDDPAFSCHTSLRREWHKIEPYALTQTSAAVKGSKSPGSDAPHWRSFSPIECIVLPSEVL